MMRKILLALATVALTLSASAQAKEKPGQWYVAPMASAIFPDGSRHLDDTLGAQLAFGRAFDGWQGGWNVELGAYGYSADGYPDTDLWGVEIDLIKPWYRDNRFSPYLLAGFGYQKSDRSGGQDDEDGGAGSLGFGFLTDLKKDGKIALRTEVRQRWDFGADTTYQDLVVNIGLQIPFGGKPEPAAVIDPDSDGDGVPDSRDMCPGTPAGAKVNSNGCPLDSDGDGVADYLDKCPGTPLGTPVDSTGCPLDSDGDGVPDTAADCPGTPPGVRVDVHGCEIQTISALSDVEFRHGSDQLTDKSRAELADEAASVRKYPNMKVEVAGHTDSTGAEEFNQALSERRAQSVSDYLVSEGVNADNLSVRGYGESQPIADNGTVEGRARNRRVELRIQD